MRYLISVDAGTTCFKAGLYDESLRPVRFASEEYTLQYLPEGFVEFPAEEYYKMLCRLVRSLLKESLGELTSFGIVPGEIYSLGGGATSRLWCQIKADVTGCRIKTLSDNEVGCLGGAILAAAGCGLVSDIAEAAQKACTVTKEYSPDPSNGATYGKAYSVFCEESGLYAQSKELRKAR